eukprot:gb/GEZN01008783.1/.p1 GENE.gb/GEZN01008783.1/~~gb/GEZN01008783.1/.p1  ORF type:complete len:424 (+),score=102.43 gb/GEZN01008783.1/:33-1304(+)
MNEGKKGRSKGGLKPVGVPGRQNLKQKIRMLERFAKKHPSEAKRNETALHQLRQELSVLDKKLEEEQKKQKIDLKYKKIRFFESQKIFRRIKKLKTSLAKTLTQSQDGGEEQMPLDEQKIRAELLQLEKDRKYVEHFPSGQKYIALYPSVPPQDPEAVHKKREELRVLIEQQLRQEQSLQAKTNTKGHDSNKTAPLIAGLARVSSFKQQEKWKQQQETSLHRKTKKTTTKEEDPLFVESAGDDEEEGDEEQGQPEAAKKELHKKNREHKKFKIDSPTIDKAKGKTDLPTNQTKRKNIKVGKSASEVDEMRELKGRQLEADRADQLNRKKRKLSGKDKTQAKTSAGPITSNTLVAIQQPSAAVSAPARVSDESQPVNKKKSKKKKKKETEVVLAEDSGASKLSETQPIRFKKRKSSKPEKASGE